MAAMAARIGRSRPVMELTEVAELRRRNAELESEIDRLRSENEQLRQHGHRHEDNHEVLPVVTEVVVTTAVDLSRLDTSLVTQISSFLGTSRELLNLALTGKSFGRPISATALKWSLMEEVARQTVCSRVATDAEMRFLPRYASGTVTWLSILHKYEHPLQFDVLFGGNIEHKYGDKTTVCGTGNYEIVSSAVSRCVMSSGSHYAEFKIISAGTPCIGIVRPMPGLCAGSYKDFSFICDSELHPDFLAQRSENWGDGNVHACEYNCSDGEMGWTYWEDEEHLCLHWEGTEDCGLGDTIGMLLNLDEGTLSVYKNNRRLGVMKDGLSGSYCWHVIVDGNDTVAIKEAQRP